MIVMMHNHLRLMCLNATTTHVIVQVEWMRYAIKWCMYFVDLHVTDRTESKAVSLYKFKDSVTLQPLLAGPIAVYVTSDDLIVK